MTTTIKTALALAVFAFAMASYFTANSGAAGHVSSLTDNVMAKFSVTPKAGGDF
jgi:hypothetical protein